MASFPSHEFSHDFVKVRFEEPHVGKGVNQRWYGMPRGVYIGFAPLVTPGSDVLQFLPDAQHGFSLLKVGAQSSRLQVDIFTDQPVTLDFSGHTQFPIYVLARADYVDGRPTKGWLLTRTVLASSPQEILVCLVDKVDGNLTADIVYPTGRQPPLAFEGQAAGYFPGGAISGIADTLAARDEVTAARTSAYTGTHADLVTRIEADQIGSSMADRLGLRPSRLLGNRIDDVSGTTANVSNSFSQASRVFQPFIDVAPGGSETTEGAITGPSDTVRNLCLVVDPDTSRRVVDPSNGEPVYGRLSYSEGVDLPAGRKIRFFNASRDVDGDGTNPFTAPLEEGDLILAPDGKYYPIETILSFDSAELGAAYQGAGFPDVAEYPIAGSTDYKRYTLTFYTVTSGGTPVSLAGENIRPLIPSFFRTDKTIYDGFTLAKMDGEYSPVPLATQTATGKVLAATTDGVAGAIKDIQSFSAPVDSDIHTLNFVYGGASTTAESGVAEVSVVGATGPAGANSGEGPIGDTGPTGYGYDVCNPYEDHPFVYFTGTSTISKLHQVDFSATSPSLGTVRHLWGGVAGMSMAEPFTFRFIGSTPIYLVGTTGYINAEMTDPRGPFTGGIGFKLYLGASGEA